MNILLSFGPWQIIFVLFTLLIFVVLPFVGLIDVLRHEFTGYNKIIWVLVILLFPLFGVILYYVIGRGQIIDLKKLPPKE